MLSNDNMYPTSYIPDNQTLKTLELKLKKANLHKNYIILSNDDMPEQEKPILLYVYEYSRSMFSMQGYFPRLSPR